MRLSTKVRITNKPAIHFVARARRESRLLDLFFDRNVSELPPSAPESPEFFPDWNITTITRIRQTKRSNITSAVFKENHSFQIPELKYRVTAMLT